MLGSCTGGLSFSPRDGNLFVNSHIGLDWVIRPGSLAKQESAGHGWLRTVSQVLRGGLEFVFVTGLEDNPLVLLQRDGGAGLGFTACKPS